MINQSAAQYYMNRCTKYDWVGKAVNLGTIDLMLLQVVIKKSTFSFTIAENFFFLFMLAI